MRPRFNSTNLSEHEQIHNDKKRDDFFFVCARALFLYLFSTVSFYIVAHFLVVFFFCHNSAPNRTQSIYKHISKSMQYIDIHTRGELLLNIMSLSLEYCEYWDYYYVQTKRKNTQKYKNRTLSLQWKIMQFIFSGIIILFNQVH